MTDHTDLAETDDERSDEFADYDGDPFPFHPQLAWSRLLRPPAVRGMAALVGGLFFLFSNRSTAALALILAIVVVAWAISEIATPEAEGRAGRVAIAMVLGGVAVALLVWPDITDRIISRLLGGAVIAYGAREVYRGVAPKDGDIRVWHAIRGGFIVAIGASLWLAPSVMLGLVIIFFALFWVVAGIATIIGTFTAVSDDVDVADVWPRFFEWLESRPHTADDRTQLYSKLFYEGTLATRRLTRFFLLMIFATTIAAFGVISDSTAVVIGAMLVAPLMTPLMGTSLSLVMGWPKRAAMSVGVALGGIVLTIGLSAVFAAMLPYNVDPVTNSQIASRIAPTMIDLVIAIAAGGAGAFALSRPDVSDALPGVAVAIALVPPLAVAGLMLEAGEAGEAFGALMLFTTNLVAILLVGALVFLLTGVVPVSKLVSERDWIRSSTTMIGILAIGVIVVLGTTSEQIRAEALDRDNVERVVATWNADQSLAVASVEVEPSAVELVLVGADRPIGLSELESALEAELGRDITLTVRWVPEERFVIDDGP